MRRLAFLMLFACADVCASEIQKKLYIWPEMMIYFESEHRQALFLVDGQTRNIADLIEEDFTVEERLHLLKRAWEMAETKEEKEMISEWSDALIYEATLTAGPSSP